MKRTTITSVLAVLEKDAKSELRSRYAISAVLLFILTTITILLIGTKGEDIQSGMAAGLLWVIMFFSSMMGLSRVFVSEEERGTGFLLQLSVSSASIYFGKLIYNILLSLLLNTVAVLLFFLFITNMPIEYFGIFLTAHIFGSIGIAAASTIISAIIAKANTKGALFPVLSFPIILPLIFIGIEATKISLEGVNEGRAVNDIQLMIAYCGIVISLSYILFDMVWKD
jgi:heme exporter protein B